ncbi:MAG: hypothetical protein ACXVCP_08180 [Bdellovibrio sp.]
MTKKIFVALSIFLSSVFSFARPFPSTGHDINCSLNVKQVTGFSRCSYGDQCPVVKSEAVVLFQTLTGDLSQSLRGTLHVDQVNGFPEANGGKLSESTIALANFLKQQPLQLEVDYAYSEPNSQFSARLSSANSSDEFNVEIKRIVDFRAGSRNNGAFSDFIKLRNYISSEGLYGHLSCSPKKGFLKASAFKINNLFN